jgi:hypothetical protein
MDFERLCDALALALLDFKRNFTLETDVLSIRIEAILSQERKPLVIFSKILCFKHLRLFIYKKEYIVILMVVDKCRYHMEYEQFVIKIDHESLKYLLNQKNSLFHVGERFDKTIGDEVSSSLLKEKRKIQLLMFCQGGW